MRAAGLLGAERRKLTSVRSTWLLLAIAQVIVVAGVSGLMLRRDDPAGDTAQRGAVAHVGLVAMLTLLLGIVAMAGEYRHRTITDTFLARPRRDRVVLAKLVVSAAAGAVFGLAASVTALLTDALWLAAKGSAIDLGSGVLWRTVAGGVGWNVAFAVLGVGVGALVANLSGAIAAALAWLALAEAVVADLLGDAGRWLPFRLGSALVGLGDGPAPGIAALGLVAYAVALAGAGVVVTRRRDIT
jgi:ABC-2 type transport system permease protein